MNEIKKPKKTRNLFYVFAIACGVTQFIVYEGITMRGQIDMSNIYDVIGVFWPGFLCIILIAIGGFRNNSSRR